MTRQIQTARRRARKDATQALVLGVHAPPPRATPGAALLLALALSLPFAGLVLAELLLQGLR